jgi:lysophospholipase L1-like esterase
VDERIRYLLKVLKEKHPNTPVILVENVVEQNSFIRAKNPARADEKSAILKKIYEDVVSDWNGRLSYVENDNRFYGNDGEASVDGVHATDVGFMRMANVINPVIEKALDIR